MASSVPANHDANLRAAIDGLTPSASDGSPSSTRLTPASDDESDIGEEGYELKAMRPEEEQATEGDWRRLAEQERQTEVEDAEKERRPYTAAEEKAVLRKLDRRLVVFMALL